MRAQERADKIRKGLPNPFTSPKKVRKKDLGLKVGLCNIWNTWKVERNCTIKLRKVRVSLWETWDTWRFIRSWRPAVKGKRAYFEETEIGGVEYLVFIDDATRPVMQIRGLEESRNPSRLLSILLKAMHLETIRAERDQKIYSVWLTILSIAVGLIFTLLFLRC